MAGYARYNSPVNRRRDRRIRGGAPQGDAMVSVITMQVILCLAVVLTLVAYRNFNPEGHAGFKAEYIALSSGDGRPEGGAVSGAADTVREFLAGLMPGVFAQRPESLPPEEALPDESVPAPGDDPQEEALHAFQYDYLDDDLFGMGGMHPHGDGVNAPSGSTYAPVFVGGYVRPPVSGLITSGFGYREHPLTFNRDFHTGMDIAAQEGAPVLSALPGIVTETGECEIYGKYITVLHGENFSSFYAHCSEVFAKEGMVVRQGERIGKVGETGMATGPHLHFSMIVDGQFTNPYWALKNDITVVGR
ncbi:MAG: M23 family metallopeptidase [Oscillospiraceae bacterium]|nr:M23 family metallopeptidase [Oscillospiraceae bacterium]